MHVGQNKLCQMLHLFSLDLVCKNKHCSLVLTLAFNSSAKLQAFEAFHGDVKKRKLWTNKDKLKIITSRFEENLWHVFMTILFLCNFRWFSSCKLASRASFQRIGCRYQFPFVRLLHDSSASKNRSFNFTVFYRSRHLQFRPIIHSFSVIKEDCLAR